VFPSPDQLARFIWAYGLPAASVIGLFMYGLLRQLYSHFYGSLGASPEEVGLGYSETLALSGIGIVWVLILPPALAVTAMTLIRGMRRVALREGLTLVAPPLGLAMLAIGVFILISGTWQATTLAYDGGAVTSVNFGPMQVLGLRAEPATVTWIAGTPPSDPAFVSGECLLYLGQANGISVFFDPGPPQVRTIRVQSSAVLVVVARAAGGPGEHQEGSVRCDANHQIAFGG
jgi:hypothetical protein